ncbi:MULTISPECIES: Hpt domain-containing protein [Acidobacteriaceae]|uniref:Hpt domain-containing protein n=1 Tax=Acidobacteriaceae TaxID=204434 RepID=UPI00131B0F47|nr:MULTISPECIES: Hpt domain-containing protein [Acidobacteriaceae]MDW5265972.1 Hpt domain-containing protein [Edaphobacter sp.]
MTPENESKKLNALLAGLWERGLPLLQERLAILDRAATAAESGELSEVLRIEALEIAHKFAGSLGMFGYSDGTEIARQIEQLLGAITPATSSRLALLVTQLHRTLQLK